MVRILVYPVLRALNVLCLVDLTVKSPQQSIGPLPVEGVKPKHGVGKAEVLAGIPQQPAEPLATLHIVAINQGTVVPLPPGHRQEQGTGGGWIPVQVPSEEVILVGWGVEHRVVQ